MRVVVFTGNPHLEEAPWWRVLAATPGLEAVLVCRKIWSSEPREVLHRFRRNVQKHGLLFIPYRVGLLALGVVARPFRRRQAPLPAPVIAGPPVEEIESLDIHSPDVLERVRAFNADLGVSLGAPILKPPLFTIPRRGTINLHLGKVPDFRGAPPAFWELVQHAPTIGATVHWMDEGLDTGAIIGSAEAPIYGHDRLEEVEARAAELGVRLLRAALDQLARGDAPGREQPTGGSTNRFPTLRQRSAVAWRLRGRRLRAALAPRQLVKTVAIAAILWIFRPLRNLARTLRRRHPVRVFTFHRVSTLSRDGMTVSPDVFRDQVTYLAAHHDIVSLERALELVRGGARLARPAAVISFDDGYRSVLDEAFPLMDALGIPGCCFVNTDLVGTDRRLPHDDANPARAFFDVMDWSQLAALRAKDWSVGNHTANHVRLSATPASELDYELGAPRRALRERLGADATVLAYPFGLATDISPEALEAAKRTGHSAVFHDYGGECEPGSDAFLLPRVDLGGDHATLAWKCQSHGIDVARWRGLWSGIGGS